LSISFVIVWFQMASVGSANAFDRLE
jgi:hypothetical protein